MEAAPEELNYFVIQLGKEALKVSFFPRTLSLLQRDLNQSVDRIASLFEWAGAGAWSGGKKAVEVFMRIPFDELCVVLWRGLNHYHPEITLEQIQAGRLHQGNIVTIGIQLAEAFGYSIGPPRTPAANQQEVVGKDPFEGSGTSSG